MEYIIKFKDNHTRHPCLSVTVDGAVFRYVPAGREGARTLVFLNGGMNTLEMWMDYVDALSDDYQVLLFDYPQTRAPIRRSRPVCARFLTGWASKSQSLSARTTAAWSRRSTRRNTPARRAA